MKRALLGVTVLMSACVDPLSAEESFCRARPQLCDAGTNAGPDASVDAGIDAGIDAGCPSSDEFDGSTWNGCFQNVFPTQSAPAAHLENGALVFNQFTGNSWSNGNEGSFLAQRVTGNFVAEVNARLVLLDGGFHGAFTAAAIVAANPLAPEVNNRLVSVGSINGPNDGGEPLYGVLSEVTGDATSVYTQIETGSPQALIRLCRVNGVFHAYWRLSDPGTWLPFSPFGPDAGGPFPETLLVGPAAYNVNGQSVARVEHEWFRISTALTNPTECGTTVFSP